MTMNSQSWRLFLVACREVLGKGDWDPCLAESWCAFLTFSSIENGFRYLNCGFPDETELLVDRTMDGGLWRQSIEYIDLAHVVIPARFYWESFSHGRFESGHRSQNIKFLSRRLKSNDIKHRLTDLVLEIKLY